MKDELRRGCLGHFGEIYDGDAPHAGRGCPAQAWSVAEVLRAGVEYAGVKSLETPAAAE